MDKLQEISDKINNLMDEYICEAEKMAKSDNYKMLGAVMVKVRDNNTWLKSVVRPL